MSRAALKRNTNIIIATVLMGLAVGGYGFYRAEHEPAVLSANTSVQQTVEAPTTNIQYQGEDGVDALSVLKKYAEVQTKSSSYGDFVTSINGNDGGGSKYWTFYVDGQEASVGAGAYITHSNESIEWKLQ